MAAPTASGLSEATALSIYKRMVTIRLAEDRIIRGLSSGEFA